jgi:hypothetical protein
MKNNSKFQPINGINTSDYVNNNLISLIEKLSSKVKLNKSEKKVLDEAINLYNDLLEISKNK